MNKPKCSRSQSYKKNTTSWESIASDYHKIVQDKGHYYHRTVILPRLLPLLSVTPDSRLLDVGCGQGILERALPKNCTYLGMDLSPSFLAIAEKMRQCKQHKFLLQDMTAPIKEKYPPFSHAVAILSLQNMSAPEKAIGNVAKLLDKNGKFHLVLNHPCFRIPRLSSWLYDEDKKLMSRKIDRYLSPVSIPIVAHPGRQQSESTVSFHFPLSYWTEAIAKHGLVIRDMQEWISSKTSSGSRARAENTARKEFPLFLFISCEKHS